MQAPTALRKRSDRDDKFAASRNSRMLAISAADADDSVQEQQQPAVCGESADGVETFKKRESQIQASAALRKRNDCDDKFAVSRSGRMRAISASDAYANVQDQQNPVAGSEASDNVVAPAKKRKSQIQTPAFRKRSGHGDEFIVSRSGRVLAASASKANFAFPERGQQLPIAVSDSGPDDKFAAVRRDRSLELSITASKSTICDYTQHTDSKKTTGRHKLEHTLSTTTGQMLASDDVQ